MKLIVSLNANFANSAKTATGEKTPINIAELIGDIEGVKIERVYGRDRFADVDVTDQDQALLREKISS